MKKTLIRFFCLLISLLFSFSTALAEPKRWLDPWIDMQESMPAAAKAQMRLTMDDAALLALFNPILDASLNSASLQGATPEAVDAYEAQMNAQLTLARTQLNTYLSAFSALLEGISIDFLATDQAAEYNFRVGSRDVARFTQFFDEGGGQYLASDLFPSYALEMTTAQGADGDLSSLDLARIQQLLSALPDYADYNILQGQVDAAQMELEALAAAGHAQRTEDGILYTGAQREFAALLEEMDLDYDPLYARLLRFSTDLSQETDAVPTDSQAEDTRFLYQIAGDTVTEETTQSHAYTAYDEVRNETAGTTARIARAAVWEEKTVVRYAAQSAELQEITGPESSRVSSIQALDNQIIFDMLTMENGIQNHFSFVLARDNDGQTFTLLLGDPQGEGLLLPLDNSDQTVAMPAMRLLLAYSNDLLSSLRLSLDVYTQGEWRAALGVSCAGEALTDAQIADIDACTRLSPDRLGTYDDKGFRKELRDIAVPRLNLLALTALPQEARPLLTPLLALIGQLGN